jgi:hypothetical protein
MTAVRRIAPAEAEAYRAFRLEALARDPSAFASNAEDEGKKPAAAARLGDGLLQIELHVSEGNGPALGLYRSCGFEAYGRKPRATVIGGAEIAKILMLRTLERVRRPDAAPGRNPDGDRLGQRPAVRWSRMTMAPA